MKGVGTMSKSKQLLKLLQVEELKNVIEKEIEKLGIAHKNYDVILTDDLDVFVKVDDKLMYIGNLIALVQRYDYLTNIKHILFHVHDARFKLVKDRDVEYIVMDIDEKIDDIEKLEKDSVIVRDEYLGEKKVKRALGNLW